MSKLLWSRQPSSNPWSDEFFSQLQIWVNKCLTNHSLCRSDGTNVWDVLTGAYNERKHLATILPTRVIDVGDNETSPSLFTSNGISGQWVALSHSWGKHQPLKLETKSLSLYSRAIPFDRMPPMFQDAVIITKRLGFRYLWIDSLCIIQDNKEDWLAEALRMGDIYKHAVFTISAEAAVNSSIGVLSSTASGRINGDQNYGETIHIHSRSAAHSIEGSLILTTNSAIKTRSDSKGPLSTRKWVLQEEVLSTRLLRFAKGQVWWQCQELQCNERFPFGYKAIDSYFRERKFHIKQSIEWASIKTFMLTSRRTISVRRGNNAHKLAKHLQARYYWLATVNEYCSRLMTHDSDTLPAISGIAKEYQRQLNKNDKSYKAGIWRDELPEDLLWYTKQPGAKLATSYVAPSWSWASMSSGPYYNQDLFEDLQRNNFITDDSPQGVASLVDINLMMSQEDPFGQVQSGFMKLKGPCSELCRCTIPATFLDCFTGNEDMILSYAAIKQMFTTKKRDAESSNFLNIRDFADQACKQGPDIQHSQCLVLHIISTLRPKQGRKIAFVMILEQTEDAEIKYRRIGLAMLLDNIKSSKIWLTRKVTII